MITNCDYCGKKLKRYDPPSKKPKLHFCNNHCMNSWRKHNNISYPGHPKTKQLEKIENLAKIRKNTLYNIV